MNEKTRVLCNAIVDRDGDAVRVTVNGTGAHSHQVREYEFPLTETDDDAAMAGIQRFIEEMEAAE